MPRPAKHSEAAILAAASRVVAARGPQAATISLIGTSIGAPNGSIYHRFRSRDELLGRLWLSKAAYFQDSWAAALDHADALEAGLEAALSLPRAARADLEGARIMLLHRREDFLSSNWPAEMKAEAERLGAQVEEGLAAMTRRLFGTDDKSARQAATFATIDIPLAAVRRHVAAGDPPPPDTERLIETAYRAVVAHPPRQPS